MWFPTILGQIDPNITLNYLILGFAVMWLIAFGYVVNLAIQQRNTRRDIELLKRLIDEDEDEDEDAAHFEDSIHE